MLNQGRAFFESGGLGLESKHSAPFARTLRKREYGGADVGAHVDNGIAFAAERAQIFDRRISKSKVHVPFEPFTTDRASGPAPRPRARSSMTAWVLVMIGHQARAPIGDGTALT